MTDWEALIDSHQEAVWEDYATSPPTLMRTGACITDEVAVGTCDAAILLALLVEAREALVRQIRTNHPSHGVPESTCGFCLPLRALIARLPEAEK